jgi:serine/threonine-protein kinase
VKHYTEDSEAYQLYLKGRYFINKGTSKDTQKSIQYFEKALQKDDRYALAYSGLADAYTLLGGTFSAPLSSWQTMPKAKAAAQKALDIDHTLAEAHTSMALVKFWYDWDWAKAEEAFQRALELRSAYPRAFQWYAEFLSAMQRHEEAITFIQKALDLDPLSVHITWHVGKIHFLARDYDAAIAQCQKALEMDANFSPAFGVLRRVYELQGKAEETLAEMERISGKNLNRVNALRQAYEQSGWQGIWQKQLEWAKAQDTPPLRYAELYTQTGNFDRAFDWLEKACQQRSSSLVYLNVFASFDPLRSDKRFKALLKKIGLAKN